MRRRGVPLRSRNACCEVSFGMCALGVDARKLATRSNRLVKFFLRKCRTFGFVRSPSIAPHTCMSGRKFMTTCPDGHDCGFMATCCGAACCEFMQHCVADGVCCQFGESQCGGGCCVAGKCAGGRCCDPNQERGQLVCPFPPPPGLLHFSASHALYLRPLSTALASRSRASAWWSHARTVGRSSRRWWTACRSLIHYLIHYATPCANSSKLHWQVWSKGIHAVCVECPDGTIPASSCGSGQASVQGTFCDNNVPVQWPPALSMTAATPLHALHTPMSAEVRMWKLC